MPCYKVNLIFPDGNEKQIEVSKNQHILDVALEKGIDLPFSCLQGWCLSCAAHIIEGTVNQEDSRRYYKQDKLEGFCLLCTGKPRSELKLQTHAQKEMRKAREKHNLPYPKGSWGEWF